MPEPANPNPPHEPNPQAAKYGGHDERAEPAAKVTQDPNPSDPGNTGTTPGSNAANG